jgi:hypothetical protein
MTLEQICAWLNAGRNADAKGTWIPYSVDDHEAYGYSENGVVGRGRYLLADEAMRIAVRTAAETAAKEDGK